MPGEVPKVRGEKERGVIREKLVTTRAYLQSVLDTKKGKYHEVPKTFGPNNEPKTYWKDADDVKGAIARTQAQLDKVSQDSLNALQNTKHGQELIDDAIRYANKLADVDVESKVKNANAKGDKTVNDVADSVEDFVEGNLFRIGKPSTYDGDKVDKNHRVGNYLRSKMSVIDLVPCYYNMSMTGTTKDESDQASFMVPEILYAEAAGRYSQDCKAHGLPKKAPGIRLYTTDDTTSMDSFTNQREMSIFENILRTSKLTSVGQNMNQLYGIKGAAAAESSNLVDSGSGLIGEGIGGLAGLVGASQESQDKTSETVKKFMRIVGNTALSGNRISFPTIWSDSSYTPNLTTTIKLVSPYGHPNAIKEFIIKPLMYLMILAAPKTSDGVSFGHPFTLTLNAYGMAYTPLAAISNISLRRGGNDSSFNIYRQPLSIDVTIEFDFLMKGFAAYSHDAANFDIHDKDIYDRAAQSGFTAEQELAAASSSTFRTSKSPSLTTIGKIVQSLQPIPKGTFHTLMGGAESLGGADAFAAQEFTSSLTPVQAETNATQKVSKEAVARQSASGADNQPHDNLEGELDQKKPTSVTVASRKITWSVGSTTFSSQSTHTIEIGADSGFDDFVSAKNDAYANVQADLFADGVSQSIIDDPITYTETLGYS